MRTVLVGSEGNGGHGRMGSRDQAGGVWSEFDGRRSENGCPGVMGRIGGCEEEGREVTGAGRGRNDGGGFGEVWGGKGRGDRRADDGGAGNY